MSNNYDHMNLDPESSRDPFFSRVKPPFEKTKEEVWDDLAGMLEDKKEAKVLPIRRNRWLIAAAAAAVILLAASVVMRYYTVSVAAPDGNLLSYSLPDGSKVEFNAGSELTYYPYWWGISREMKFQGEAYFEVEKGKSFRVHSENGTTEVLGTSFTIYARQDEYRVACFTGAVKVTSPSRQEVVLNPDYRAVVNSAGDIKVSREESHSNSKIWMKGMFSFSARPLRLVLDEIERQYNVRIIYKPLKEYSYSGYFSKDKSVEEVLGLVCKPFGLTFARTSDDSFEIYQN